MQKYISKTWGYNIIDEFSFSFYHVLLLQISLKTLCQNIPGIEEIIADSNGSIVVQTQTLATTLRNTIDFFEKIEIDYLETGGTFFNISNIIQNRLLEWKETYVSILALLLCKKYNMLEWGILRAGVLGFYIEDFTIIIESNSVRVIHPITIKNFAMRKAIEKLTADYIEKIAKYIKNKNANKIGGTLITYAAKNINVPAEIVMKLILYKLQYASTQQTTRG